MIMTEELEGRMQNMCNLSELVKESAVKNERIEAIKRMIKANITNEKLFLAVIQRKKLKQLRMHCMQMYSVL